MVKIIFSGYKKTYSGDEFIFSEVEIIFSGHKQFEGEKIAELNKRFREIESFSHK